MKKKEFRKKKVLDLLRQAGQLDLQYVIQQLDVSEATGRRLFAELEEEGTAIRVMGGVRLKEESFTWATYSTRSEQNSHQKGIIGRAAANLVQSGDSLFVDSGTTVIKVAEALAERIREGDVEEISIITNSLTIADIIAQYAKVILLGGETRLDHRDVCGYLTEKNLEPFHFRRAFLGSDAISLTGGFMTSDERTAKLNELVLTRSLESFVLADASKFGKEGFMRFAEFADIGGIYTDSNLEPALATKFRSKGANIILSPE